MFHGECASCAKVMRHEGLIFDVQLIRDYMVVPKPGSSAPVTQMPNIEPQGIRIGSCRPFYIEAPFSFVRYASFSQVAPFSFPTLETSLRPTASSKSSA